MSDLMDFPGPCRTCKDARAKEGKKPRLLKPLPVSTQNKKLKVLACSYCDGPVIELVNKQAS